MSTTHFWFYWNKCFYYNVFYFLKKHTIVNIIGFEYSSKTSKAPFWATYIIFSTIILYEGILIVFINRVVSKMGEFAFKVVGVLLHVWCYIRSSSKSCQTFIKHIDTKRIDTCKSHINSEIWFESINEQWISYVMTNQHLLFLVVSYFWKLVCYYDTFTLRATWWFSYPKLILISLHLMLQFINFSRKEIALWNKVKISTTMSLLHILYFLNKIILSCQLNAFWKLIYSLTFIKSCEERVL